MLTPRPVCFLLALDPDTVNESFHEEQQCTVSIKEEKKIQKCFFFLIFRQIKHENQFLDRDL
jgi:hypothetical protein